MGRAVVINLLDPMLKILFIGNTDRTALALHYFTNMVRLGHIVLPYDPEYFFARHVLDKIAIRVRRSPTASKQEAVARTLTSLCKKNLFDVIFVMAENFLTYDTIEEMRKASRKSLVFIYHSHDNNFSTGILKPPNFQKTLLAYDYLFTTKSYNIHRYQDLGHSQVHFLPSAFEPSHHHPISDSYSVYGDKLFDVTFLGTFDRSRAKYLDAAGWDRLRVWGDHWKQWDQFKKHKERIHNRAIYDFEFADVTSHTKCALGLLREEAEDLHTTRTFEIPACGAAQFAPRNDEIRGFFEEDKEIVLFDSPEELKDKLDFYLTHDWHRQRVAQAGYERCLRDKHTYLDRVVEILRIIGKGQSVSLPSPTASAALPSPSL